MALRTNFKTQPHPLQSSVRKSCLFFLLAAILTFFVGNLSFADQATLLSKKSPTWYLDEETREFFRKKNIKNWGLSENGISTICPSQSITHIDALKAWEIQDGKPSVIVAVIDTGIDPKHKNLAPNIWKNVSESSKSPPSQDDLKREPARKTSSAYGWNFVCNSDSPNDSHGHGTHVAGIIGATANSKVGISGVAHRVKLMPVKWYSDSSSAQANLSNSVRAIHYAIDHGAHIINYSGGGPEYSREEYLAIKRAEAHGILFVCAAGNETQDTDLVENRYYPSSYRLSNIISVAATTKKNELLLSSNWGRNSVDVGAPGEDIYSTMPNNQFGYMSGTSQATAFVSGIAALLLSENPNLKPSEIRDIIRKSADPIASLKNKTISGGKVNAYRALKLLKSSDQNPSTISLGKKPKSKSSESASTKAPPPRTSASIQKEKAALQSKLSQSAAMNSDWDKTWDKSLDDEVTLVNSWSDS